MNDEKIFKVDYCPLLGMIVPVGNHDISSNSWRIFDVEAYQNWLEKSEPCMCTKKCGCNQ